MLFLSRTVKQLFLLAEACQPGMSSAHSVGPRTELSKFEFGANQRRKAFVCCLVLLASNLHTFLAHPMHLLVGFWWSASALLCMSPAQAIGPFGSYSGFLLRAWAGFTHSAHWRSESAFHCMSPAQAIGPSPSRTSGALLRARAGLTQWAHSFFGMTPLLAGPCPETNSAA